MRNITDKNEYLYDAFISYRHTEPDKFVAETLHREMENFKLPGNLIKKLDCSGKTRINRVFRDRDELPITSNLADPITEALEASEFLIVICSPRLPESLWCKKEIETFIQIHGRDHVLAVLIEGEPDDSFPEELRFVESKRVNRDGTVTVERIPVEPLAADVRGKSRREIKRKIKEEVIRLAAPMFDCSYDELKQRHRERRIRRILTAVAAGSAVCLIFGAVSTAMAWKIHGQNVEITEKSKKIEEQSEEIREQYWTALKNYALGEADNALELLERGDRIEAVRIARAILPEWLEEQEIPYTYQAEYALSRSLEVYANGEAFMADFMLKHHTNVSACKVSPDGNRLLTADDAGNIYVWDLVSGELLLENHDYRQSFSITNEKLEFLDNDTFFYMGYEKGVLFDIPTKRAEEFELESGGYMKADKRGGQIAMLESAEIRIMDVESLTVTHRYQAEDGWKVGGRFDFSEDGSMLVFSVSKEAEKIWEPREETKVLVMDCRSGEIINFYIMEQEEISQLVFDQNMLYISNYENFFATEENSYFNERLEGLIYACDLSIPNTVSWIFKDPEKAMKYIKPAGKADSDLLLCTSYSGLYLLDKQDGRLIGRIDLGEGIVNIKNIAGDESFFVYTDEGNIFFVRNQNGILEAIDISYLFECNSDNIKQMETGAGGMVITLPHLSANITVFKTKRGAKFQEVAKREDYIHTVVVSPDNDILIVRDGGNIIAIYNAATGEQTGEMEEKGHISEFVFVGKEQGIIAANAGNKIYLNENITGKAVAEHTLEGLRSLIYNFFIGEYNQRVISISAGGAVIYDTLSGKELKRLETGEALYGGKLYAVSSVNEYLAVVFPEEGKLCLYSLKDMGELQTISLNGAFVSNLFFDDRTDMLYVVYKDQSVEAYTGQKETWSLQKKYTSFDEEMREAVNLGDGSRVILKGIVKSYLLKDGEMVAELPGFQAVRTGGEIEIYVGVREVLLKVPLYEYDMLMEEAAGY